MKARRKLSKKARAWGWTKFILFLFMLILVALTSGFVTFANSIKTLAPPNPVPAADGIVVLTGKGGGRLETGAMLLSDQHAERLFISGVNPSATREEILELLALPAELGECCVDLDYAAMDTVQNGVETAAWAEALGYEHIILVTSAYHMPRAQNEIARAMAETGLRRIKITAYPVSSDLADKWWTDKKSLDRLLREYGKLLVTLVRKSEDKDLRGPPILEPEPIRSEPEN